MGGVWQGRARIEDDREGAARHGLRVRVRTKDDGMGVSGQGQVHYVVSVLVMDDDVLLLPRESQGRKQGCRKQARMSC